MVLNMVKLVIGFQIQQGKWCFLFDDLCIQLLLVVVQMEVFGVVVIVGYCGDVVLVVDGVEVYCGYWCFFGEFVEVVQVQGYQYQIDCQVYYCQIQVVFDLLLQLFLVQQNLGVYQNQYQVYGYDQKWSNVEIYWGVFFQELVVV